VVHLALRAGEDHVVIREDRTRRAVLADGGPLTLPMPATSPSAGVAPTSSSWVRRAR